ncbi:MAG TPA: sigma-70 domain-containing protein [Myxococcota bacterium]|nr:sigma-70 domain-containing protein [Myxococcota bacterium]
MPSGEAPQHALRAKQSFIRVVQNHSRTVRLPSHLYDLLLRYERANRRLSGVLGRQPSTSEMCETLKIDEDEMDKLREVRQQPLSLETLIPGAESKRVKDVLSDPGSASSSPSEDASKLQRHLEQLLEALDARERRSLSGALVLAAKRTTRSRRSARRSGSHASGSARSRPKRSPSSGRKCLRSGSASCSRAPTGHSHRSVRATARPSEPGDIGIGLVTLKLFAAVGVGLALPIPGRAGYAPTAAQAPEVLLTLRALYALVPCNLPGSAIARTDPIERARLIAGATS